MDPALCPSHRVSESGTHIVMCNLLFSGSSEQPELKVSEFSLKFKGRERNEKIILFSGQYSYLSCPGRKQNKPTSQLRTLDDSEADCGTGDLNRGH